METTLFPAWNSTTEMVNTNKHHLIYNRITTLFYPAAPSLTTHPPLLCHIPGGCAVVKGYAVFISKLKKKKGKSLFSFAPSASISTRFHFSSSVKHKLSIGSPISETSQILILLQMCHNELPHCTSLLISSTLWSPIK